ncbi:MAG TPA: DsbA family protein, partial [archaeon]|nr:DsbA family protein [archaeon]
MRHEHSQANKILVLHATAPTCWWSWGYEAVIHRLRMVYGDQIEIRIWTAFVYEDFDEHLKHYEMTWQDYLNWAKEGVDIMKVPLETNLKREKMSKTVFPATVAFFAALKQDHKKAERLSREFMRLSNVEFKDVSDN